MISPPLPQPHWDDQRLGHHRLRVRVNGQQAVRALLPRLRALPGDALPRVLVTDAVGNAMPTLHQRRTPDGLCEVIFEPLSGPGEYLLYPRPFGGRPSHHYPEVHYLEAETGWPPDTEALAQATVLKLESISEHHAYSDMEWPASPAELQGLLARHPGARALVFAEDREHPIRMTREFPRRWLERGQPDALGLSAQPGEWLAFQLGVWAVGEVRNLRIECSPTSGPVVLPASAFTCLNIEGVSPGGQAFGRRLTVPAGRLQALWCGVQLPLDAPAGLYEGRVTVLADGFEQAVPLRLDVQGDPLSDAGDAEPQRLSRLRWLNSRIGQDDLPVAPYTAISRRGRTLELLGRRVTLNEHGLPAQLDSLFTPDSAEVVSVSTALLTQPMTLDLVNEQGEHLFWQGGPLTFETEAPGRVVWRWAGRAGPLTIDLRGELEFDGALDLQIELGAEQGARLQGATLTLALREEVSRFLMGLGQPGGYRPARLDWRWDARQNQDAVWLGAPHAGVQLSLRDERYLRPLNTNFYHLRPLVMPQSWDNGGQGGVRGRETPQGFRLEAYSGPFALAAGESRHFNLRLLLTPFHPLETCEHFSARYFHREGTPEAARAAGASVMNVHHATGVNPYINYPFLSVPALKAFTEDAHARDVRVKLYYTVRELTNRAPELWALRSLGHEVLAAGPGGGSSWLQEHLGEDYIGAWYVHALEDAAVVLGGVSRWHNHYLEGLDWLARELEIDGLYLDDLAVERGVMQRLRKVLRRRQPHALIDLHSANQFNEKDGHASSANLYLEHFPYLDRLWFGEYFSPDLPPDGWLVELSGVPFGLMGEMLEGGGNPWRGALFGMSARLYHDHDPTPVWRLWDAFGIADSRMLGWWLEAPPIRSDRPDVPVTTFLKSGRALIALASWAPEPVDVRLRFDWSALGLDPARARLHALASEGFQVTAEFAPEDPISVEPGRGWMLTLEQT